MASLPLADRKSILRGLTLDDEEAALVEFEWALWARPNQLEPEGDWRYWLIKAGRGFGKTRSGAEWVRAQVAAGRGRIALVGPTAADARDVMVEGPSGILNICPPWDRPNYEPSKRRLTWPNGALATLYSAEEPERLRGPQHDAAWADELAAWKYLQETWDQLQFGLRIGTNPRCAITTTPKPLPLVRQLAKDPDCVVTSGTTYENAENLAPAFISRIVKRYEGTRLGRQELEAELLEDTPGALWPRALIETARPKPGATMPAMIRIVVGVDPSGSDGETGDSQGIVVCGLGNDGRGYVLQDGSCRLSPEGWSQRVASLYSVHKADRVAAEVNYGGAMVEAVLRISAPNLPVTLVSASRGKHVRAEPVAALYEQGRITHVEPFVELEDQMALMTSQAYEGPGSPDRLDALVWAITELMLPEMSGGAGFIEYARQQASAPVKAPALIANGSRLRFPSGTTKIDMNDGTHYEPGEDGCFVAKPEHVGQLQGIGCVAA